MKKALITLIIAISLSVLFACDQSKRTDSANEQKATQSLGIQKDVYRCPMHPQVRLDEPGECPICHMTLEKIRPTMNSAEAAENAAEKKIKYYRNPMNPSIHSDKPAKDSMGMDYIPVYGDENRANKASGQELARGSFTLTPEKLKLSGAHAVAVEKRDLIFEIRTPGRVLGGSRVSFQAFEQDSAFIKTGMDFEAESPSVPGQVLEGRVTSIDSILDPMTRTVRVDGVVSNAGKFSLKTEASVVGKLKVKHLGVLAIPEAAVLHTGTRDLVYVTDGQGGFSPQIVTLGVKAQGFYEVKSGLNAGDKISSGPNFLLDSESRIEFTQ